MSDSPRPKHATKRAMPRFRLSSRAESDLAEIADYTIETFGLEQARRYIDGLEACRPVGTVDRSRSGEPGCSRIQAAWFGLGQPFTAGGTPITTPAGLAAFSGSASARRRVYGIG